MTPRKFLVRSGMVLAIVMSMFIPTGLWAQTPNSGPGCYGTECNEADPVLTGCAAPERDAYDQAIVPVHQPDVTYPELLGTLYLRANHEPCGSTQWAFFDDLSRPLTFELRVVQEGTDVSEVLERLEPSDQNAWTAMVHSPDDAMRAEIAVYDSQGEVLVEVVTDFY